MEEVDSSDDEAGAVPGYQDLGAQKKPALIKKQKTVTKQFNAFLTSYNNADRVAHPYTTLEQAIAAEDGQGRVYLQNNTLIGQFANYLEIGRAGSTSTTLFSTFTAMLRNDYHIVIDLNHATRCRDNMMENHNNKCDAAGIDRAKQAPPIQPSELNLFCEILFEEDTLWSIQARAALILQWQTMGRVSEVFSLKMNAFMFCEEIGIRTVKVNVNRAKVSARNVLRLFVQRDNLFPCPIHALACYVLVHRLSDNLFPGISASSAAKYMNDTLKQLSSIATDRNQKITKSLTSHSLRSGPATFCQQHRDIKEACINERGGWSIRGTDNSRIYRWTTSVTDGGIGRVLSGWHSVTSGDLCPMASSKILGSARDFELFI